MLFSLPLFLGKRHCPFRKSDSARGRFGGATRVVILSMIAIVKGNTRGCLLAACLASPFGALAAEPSPSAPSIAAPSNLDAALIEYRRKLEVYTRARQQYDHEAAAYWTSVAEKRLRNSKRRSNQESRSVTFHTSAWCRSIPMPR